MFHSNLYESILLAPALQGANRLCVITGFATAAMASRHLHVLMERELDVKVDLMIGMTPREGVSRSDHHSFQALSGNRFSCRYVTNGPPVHSKVYIWSDDDGPLLAYTGSANYTQTAFSSAQREVLTGCDPHGAQSYFDAILPDTMACQDPNVVRYVSIFDGARVLPKPQLFEQAEQVPPRYKGLPFVVLSLLTRQGTMHRRSGLNWGQREEHGREPNQAYIPVQSPIKNTDFFPPRGVYFTALADDGVSLTLTRAQDGDKAIHTPWNNSELGEYFRRRLDVPPGAFVEKEHLLRYGRTNVTFYKLDDETYYMDFSAPSKSSAP